MLARSRMLCRMRVAGARAMSTAGTRDGKRRVSTKATDATIFCASSAQSLGEQCEDLGDRLVQAHRSLVLKYVAAFGVVEADDEHDADEYVRIYEQLLDGHDEAFEAVSTRWREGTGLGDLVASGGVDATLAAELEAAVEPYHQASLFRALDCVDSKVLLCNTMRLASTGSEVNYVAVVQYTPSPADARRGLQTMWCTYTASAEGKGSELYAWLHVAMEGNLDAQEQVPLRWRLRDVNFRLHGVPQSDQLLGVAKPIYDEYLMHVAPAVAICGLCFLALFVENRYSQARAEERRHPTWQRPDTEKLLHVGGGTPEQIVALRERERADRSTKYWR